MMEMFLTVEQVAARLRLRPDAVRERLARGRLHGVKRGRQWRIPESALVEQKPPLTGRDSQDESPLARALVMVKERDARLGKVRLRRAGMDDAATELRVLREERAA